MKIILNDKEYTLEYKETHIGDEIYDQGMNKLYIASINDADNLNWVVIDSRHI